MKYIFLWVAIFGILIIGLPMCLGIWCTADRKYFENDKQSSFISVYLTGDDKVKSMATEDYILGVLMAEMPASFEPEALKAQCVAARTYLHNKVISGGDKSVHKGADICTDPAHCQAYVSREEAKAKWNKNASLYFKKCKLAVKETEGIIACYDEKPINAVFHAFAGGKTENASDVWGSDVPYLKSVDSPGDSTAPRFESVAVFSRGEFIQTMFRTFGCSFDNCFIGESTFTSGGAVDKILIGDKLIDGTDVRKALGLRSACFAVSYDDTQVVFNVKGYGHGVGMSQYGADYFASQGMKYDEILKKYYTGISLEKRTLPKGNN